MDSTKKKVRIIWPANINSKKTIKEGRTTPIKKSILDPTVDEIYEAAKILRLNPQKESNKCYPKSWWEFKGRIIIDNINIKNKKDILIQIIKIIKEKRK